LHAAKGRDETLATAFQKTRMRELSALPNPAADRGCRDGVSSMGPIRDHAHIIKGKKMKKI
jgi:hypothetical protein